MYLRKYKKLGGSLRSFLMMVICALSALSNAAYAQSQEVTPKGSLVIIGGALRVNNDAVWKRIIQQAGGKGAVIAVIPTASANPVRAGQLTAETLNQYGAKAFVVPVSVKHPQLNYKDVVKDAAWVKRIEGATGIYFTGGDQGRTTQALLESNGDKTPLLQAIWDVYNRGGVIAGSSAGAAIMSSTMFYDAKPVLPTLKFGVTDGQEIAPGLGFIGDQVFVDQHLIIRGRFARMLPVMLKKNYKLALGIDENTAMVITGRRHVEVIGYKGAILIDLSNATQDASLSEFNLQNAKISYLDQGDRFDLQTKTFTISESKQHGEVNPELAYHRGKIYYNDILANTAVVDLLFTLIDSKEPEAIGLAFGDTRQVNPEEKSQLGFEFRFSKTQESKGFYSGSSGAEAYSVQNVQMDIRPITIAAPFYH